MPVRLRYVLLLLIWLLDFNTALPSEKGRRGGEPAPRLRAYKTAKLLPLDGDLDNWRGAESVSFAGSSLAGRPRRARVYVLWDDQNLYLAFDVHSSKLQAVVRQHGGDNLWLDDGVEFLIDSQLRRSKKFLAGDFSYHINILNAVYDDHGTLAGEPAAKWDGQAQHAVKVLDDFHYIVEVAVPWSEINLQPRAGRTSVGIDFCVNGRDPTTGEYDYFDWCGLKVFHDPSGYGELELAGPRVPR